jgi:hypothetical protein
MMKDILRTILKKPYKVGYVAQLAGSGREAR